ncbi:MAG: IS200/IS605 family transposase [Ignavibacteriales bacterium]|nr:IS200/IS605 family transposase [Ignavibacteriales bacterium]
MSYVRVWIHAVWGTKNREPLLTKEIRLQVIDHIRANAKEKQIYIDRLNGYTDHLHCLFGLNADRAIAKTMQLMKGESAYWINKEKITLLTFERADEYYAVSVSESDLERVRAYIDNQEEHHKRRTFAEEVAEFMQKHGLARHG